LTVIFSYCQNWLNGLWDVITTQLHHKIERKKKHSSNSSFFAVFGIKETLNTVTKPDDFHEIIGKELTFF
jgi:hypothetical protein